MSENAASHMTSAPIASNSRIQSLDVLRGVALLGILLLNILGFGMVAAGYFHPLVGLGENAAVNYTIWGIVNLFFEGSMRGLFSLLFGAGIVMFTTGIGTRSGRKKSPILHYKRTFFLLLIGMFDAFVLLWTGDILILYAVAGAVLYPLRKARPKTLISLSILCLLFSSAVFAISGLVMEEARDAAIEIDSNPSESHSEEKYQLAELWTSSENQFQYNESAMQKELEIRQGGYFEIAEYGAKNVIENWFFFVPLYMFWDCVGMMLLGMALYRLGFLSGKRTKKEYLRFTIIGFSIGLAVNGFELYQGIVNDFDALVVSGYFQGTYHLGRVGMALGWLGAIMLFCQTNVLNGLRLRLAAVGRTALSNYLLHSVLCLVIFSGAGFGLVGVLERWQLYVIVVLIWSLQLIVSPWWLKRYAFGPAEWLWRSLTYNSKQKWRL